MPRLSSHFPRLLVRAARERRVLDQAYVLLQVGRQRTLYPTLVEVGRPVPQQVQGNQILWSSSPKLWDAATTAMVWSNSNK